MSTKPHLYKNINQVFKNTKNNILSLSDVATGAIAYATDTNQLGYYNGTSWVWTSATSAGVSIPIADDSGKLDGWISDSSTSIKGKVQLATDGESAAGKAVQANDTRLSNSRTPTAHASTHKHGGSDEVASATAGANLIPKANSGGTIDLGWLPSVLTGKDADTLDGQHGSYYAHTLEQARAAGNQISGNIDFNHYKAIAMACDSGSTLPSSPVIGQWFLHTPTGRKVLMMYNGSSWSPIISFGSMTMYVDSANGTNDPNKGYGTGTDAFATIQYAIDTIPGLYSGDVLIYVASGTYSAFIINGKNPTGNFYIYIFGTLQTDATYTITTGTVGSLENHATITVTGAGWTNNQWEGYLAYYNGEYRVIRSNTSDTLQLVGYASSTPTGTLEIKSQATVIGGGGSTTFIYSKNVRCYYLFFNGIQFRVLFGGSASAYYCKFTHSTNVEIVVDNFGSLALCYSYVYFTSNTYFWIIQISNFATINTVLGTYIHNKGTRALSGIYMISSSSLTIYGGQIVIENFNYGVDCKTNSTMDFNSGGGKSLILNCNTGVYARQGAQSLYISHVYFSGCTTNYTAESASYAYLG